MNRQDILRIRRKILDDRGVGREEFDAAFAAPSLENLRDVSGIPDLVGLAEALVDAVISRREIALYGDYDADGISSVAVLTRFLRSQGVRPRTALASRLRGYGFRAESVAGADLAVVCDCGTTDETGVAAAEAAGTRVGIIDHHSVPRDPGGHPATWLVNPKRQDSCYPFDGLCSAALAWVVASVAAERLGIPPPTDLLPIAAVAQVADAGDLRWEGRILTVLGMREPTPPGIAALLERGGSNSLTPRTAGWVVGPRLNAPGRMGDPTPALDVLVEDSPLALSQAADRVDAENAARKEVSDRATELARATCRKLPSAVYASGAWPAGVSGIIAGRLAEDTGLPAFVVSLADDSSGTGSARAAGGCSVYDALASADRYLSRWGGHRAAAGFRFPPGGEAEFVAALSEWRPERDVGGGPTNTIPPIDLGGISFRDAYQAVCGLEPFGPGFPEPLFRTRGVVTSARHIGRNRDHLEIRLDGDRRCVLWRAEIDPPAGGETVDIVGKVRTNVWNGRRTYEMDVDRVDVA